MILLDTNVIVDAMDNGPGEPPVGEEANRRRRSRRRAVESVW